MATAAPVITRVAEFKENAHTAGWALNASNTSGDPVMMPGSVIRSVQIAGTFDGSTITLQGSNDGTNYVTLTDPQGNAISKTAAAIEQIEDNTLYIKPSGASMGANTAITVTVLVIRRGA